MVILPTGDIRSLIYLGRILDASQFGNMIASSMSTISILDLFSSKWNNQNASGDIPASRRRFRALSRAFER